jgi:antitoxin Phd
MMRTWQLHEAKNKFSEVVEEASRSGPQMIVKRGVETAVVLSYADFRQLMTSQQKLSTLFRESPLAEAPLDLRRDMSAARREPTS